MNIYLLVIFVTNIFNFFIGIILGAGAILPGVSSGVICVIMGIYDKLIDSILNLFKNFKKNFLYLFPIGLGGIVGVFLFGNILKALFNTFPAQASFCFIGLILGSIPTLIKKVNSEHVFRLRYLLFTLISFILGISFVFLENKLNTTTAVTNFSYLFLILSGFLMSIGVVFPGVSNTLILMCLGVYSTYLDGIASMNFSILIPIGIGLVIGCICFLIAIKYLLKHFYMQTYYSIIGFTLGSILVLYTPIAFDLSGITSIILLIICFKLANKFG